MLYFRILHSDYKENDSSSGFSVVKFNKDGSNETKLFDTTEWISVVYAPSANRIAINEDITNLNKEIITNNDSDLFTFLDWSPDGNKVLYKKNTTPTNNELIIYNLINDTSHTITTNIRAAAWRFGTELIYINDTTANVYAYNELTDNTRSLNYALNIFNDAELIKDPTDSNIFYYLQIDYRHTKLYKVELKNTGPIETLLREGNCWHYNISYDGKTFLFLQEDEFYNNFYTMNIDGSKATKIISEIHYSN